tara:strand:- start:15 stop:305 length:291 start_codon:yes stop_codon:yes gene_type:complete
MKIDNIHNIPLKVRIGCLALLFVIIFIFIILLVGFVQVFTFLIDTWFGATFIGLLILYFLYRKFLPKLNIKDKPENTKNNYSEAEYIEIEDEDSNK